MELHARGRMSLRDLMDAYERRLIEEALRATGGNQRRAAQALGVLPTTLHEKMKRLGLVRRAKPVADGPRRLTDQPASSNSSSSVRCTPWRAAPLSFAQLLSSEIT